MTMSGPFTKGLVLFCDEMPTALAHIFADDGFVIAADGLSIVTKSDSAERRSVRTQKIFLLPGTRRKLACAFTGMVTLFNDARDKVAFNFISEVLRAARKIQPGLSRDGNDYVYSLSGEVLRRLVEAKESGKFTLPHSDQPNPHTIVRVYVDGYLDGRPFRTGIKFCAIDQILKRDFLDGIDSHDLTDGKSRFNGSRRLAKLFFHREDARLIEYRTAACRRITARIYDPELPLSLAEAIDAARNFIAASSARVAKEIEGDAYQRIGGKLQLATITPKKGFQWIERPEKFDPL